MVYSRESAFFPPFSSYLGPPRLFRFAEFFFVCCFLLLLSRTHGSLFPYLHTHTHARACTAVSGPSCSSAPVNIATSVLFIYFFLPFAFGGALGVRFSRFRETRHTYTFAYCSVRFRVVFLCKDRSTENKSWTKYRWNLLVYTVGYYRNVCRVVQGRNR